MSVSHDMIAAYRHPRAVFRRRAGTALREDRALVVLMVACLLIFVGQWPRLERTALATGEDLQPLIGGALFGWMFIMPLVAYALGTLSHLAARAAGGHGSAYASRFALFWALLCAAPLWLLWGLAAGMLGQGVALSVLGLVALGAFLVLWGLNFHEANWGEVG